jgi:uncharacterized membrane protein
MTAKTMERIVGRLLQTGVLLSAAVVIAGGVWLMSRSGSAVVDFRQFRAEPRELRSVSALLKTASRPEPEAVIQFGLMLLIATPVARVIFSMVAFALQRDRAYVIITMIVLAVLAYSLVVPHG